MNKGIEPIKAQVLDIFEVTEGIYELELQAPAVVEQARPGQFAMLRPGNGGKPYLARPMGIYDVNPKRDSISILFEVHGPARRQWPSCNRGTLWICWLRWVTASLWRRIPAGRW